MNLRLPAVLAALVAAGAGLGLLPTTTATRLDAVTADYHEDAPGARAVAALEARLLRAGTRRWLELDVCARGPRVVPYPGLTGVHGSNLKTAQELHAICRDRRLRMVVRDGAREHVGGGTIAQLVHSQLPARRLRPDGEVDLHAVTDAAWPTTLTLRSDALPAGSATFEVLVDDLSRLRVNVAHDRITAIESLGEPPAELRRSPEVTR